MKPGDLVQGSFENAFGEWTRQGLFLGFMVSGNYQYSEVYWFYENIISSIQTNRLEVLQCL
jgi:hypothetical protein